MTPLARRSDPTGPACRLVSVQFKLLAPGVWPMCRPENGAGGQLQSTT
jgi:hypothetical protein